jgi:hypothetical protein
MPDRIEQLAREVFSFKYKTAPDELNPGHTLDDLRLFAELIVRECSSIIEKRDPRTEPAEHIYVLKYFGVKI